MSLDQEAYATMVRYIRENGLSKGSRLPPERVLATHFGMSRNRLRLALTRLEMEGVILRHVGRGTFVGTLAQQREEATARAASFTSPREVMEARLALEPSLARLAAQRATTQDFERLDSCLAKGSSPEDIPGFRRWDMKLHLAVTKAAGNNLLQGIFEHIHADRARYLWGKLRHSALNTDRIRTYAKQHRCIVQAIRERDPVAAEEQMRFHLEAVRGHLFGGF